MMNRGRVIAVLGAESTGKTTLCQALAHRLALQPGWSRDEVGLVGETLRAFCDREGRTPRRDEQGALAEAHAQRIRAAAQRHRVVVADTSAVMTAVYSLFIFGDRSLHETALASHRDGVDATLVTALDLPWVADGHQRDGPHVREPVDRLLRIALNDSRIEYAVIAGQADDRVDAAWRALGPHRRSWGWAADGDPPGAGPAKADETSSAMPRLGLGPRWRAWCECCADPAAEAADFRSRRPTPPPR